MEKKYAARDHFFDTFSHFLCPHQNHIFYDSSDDDSSDDDPIMHPFFNFFLDIHHRSYDSSDDSNHSDTDDSRVY